MVQARLLLSAALVSLLAACASPEGAYPSLAVRDVERISGSMEVEPAPLLEPPAPATLANLEDLAENARAAHQRFLAAAPDARAITNAAAGASRGSEAWARAQVAIANLEAQRSQTMIALADMDRIYVDAATSAVTTESITEVRSDIDALVEEQNALIQSLLATLAG
ncbi:hypothetical protein [Aurantiacibacter hainanensis]|uniref:hypothetical protein n=1 Tax=Aurantiacibacter hainanensis TaxID=3076114 RepID=UPI0030C75502